MPRKPKPRRKIMCADCRTIFTTNSKKRFKCKKCDPPKPKTTRKPIKKTKGKWNTNAFNQIPAKK